MGYREKIIEALKNSKIRLLGQIEISEEEYKDLLHYAKRRALGIQPQTIMPADILLSVALVQVAIWRCILQTL